VIPAPGEGRLELGVAGIIDPGYSASHSEAAKEI